MPSSKQIRYNNLKPDITNNHLLVVFLLISFRLIISVIKPYPIDMGGYVAWSNYLAELGPSDFYGSSGFHVVYAPFYLYFLWFTGEIVKIFSFSPLTHAYLIKLWAVTFEFIGAFLILIIGKKINRFTESCMIAILYFVNPAIIMNSSIWGQFDSIPATMLLGVLLLFEYKKNNFAALLFLIAVLTKPQSGLLLPVVLYLYFRDFTFNKKSIIKLIMGLTSGLFLYFLIVTPFYLPTSLSSSIPRPLDQMYWLFDLYFRSIKDYPYATANAFNIWFLLGGQIKPDIMPFVGLSYLTWGNLLLIMSLVFAFICLLKGRGSLYAISYFSYLVLFSAFLFMTKMHERYLLPAIIFIALSCLFDKNNLLTFGLISCLVFINQFYLYIISFREIYWLNRWDAIGIIISALLLVTYILSIYKGYDSFIKTKRILKRRL